MIYSLAFTVRRRDIAEWIIPCSLKQHDIISVFEELDCIDLEAKYTEAV